MQCPRCGGETDIGARSCAHCEAPLLLHDDPVPRPLERMLELDRRRLDRRGLESSRCAPRWLEDDPTRPEQPSGRVPAVEVDGPEEGNAGELPLEPAPRGQRAAAWVVDAAVLVAAAGAPLLLAASLFPGGTDLVEEVVPTALAFSGLVGFVYLALGHALMGATFGKRLLGLQMVGLDGRVPGLARCSARAALAILGAVPLGLGLLFALFTRSGRGLHDLVTDTVVVRAP